VLDHKRRFTNNFVVVRAQSGFEDKVHAGVFGSGAEALAEVGNQARNFGKEFAGIK
jgi:hypothetical protein